MKSMKFSSSFIVLLAVVCSLTFRDSIIVSGNSCRCKGGDTVTGSGATTSEACQDAQSKCEIDDSDCPENTTCERRPRCGVSLRTTRNMNGRRTCSFRCTSAGMTRCTMTGGGKGDPHLTGFDGSSFDFHGKDGKSYVLFGRSVGDLLVSKMRSTESLDSTGTFFDQFGLQVAKSTDRVSVSLVENPTSKGWHSEVKVNNKIIHEDVTVGNCRIEISPKNDRISVMTLQTKFVFQTKRLSDAGAHHLDVAINLIGPSAQFEPYFGVLGVTLNRALGHDIHPELRMTKRYVELEQALRRRFEVKTIFPEVQEKTDRLSGIVRIALLDDVEHPGKTWSAKTDSTV